MFYSSEGPKMELPRATLETFWITLNSIFRALIIRLQSAKSQQVWGPIQEILIHYVWKGAYESAFINKHTW